MKRPALEPLKRYRFKVVLAPFLKLFEVASELCLPFLVKYLIDEGIDKGDTETIFLIGGIMLALGVVGFAITILAQYLSASVASSFGYDLRKKLYGHLDHLSEKELNAFGKEKALTLVANDSFALQNGVNMFMRLLLRSPFLVLGSLILSFFINVYAGLIFLGVVVLSVIVMGLVMVLSPKRYGALQSDLDTISREGGDALKGARPIRAFNKEKMEEDKFAAASARYEKDGLAIGRLNALINPLTFCFVYFGLAAIVYLGGHPFGGTALSTGSIVSLVSYLTTSLASLVMFSRLIVSLNRARASLKRLDAFLETGTDVRPLATKTEKDGKPGPLIQFANVSLTYGFKGEAPAVQGLTFAINPGQTIGFIGGTGSGKSTTIALLERLYEPSEGQLFYRGLPLKDYDLGALREEISLVSQKPSIFEGTVRSNLLLGKATATEEEMVAALKESLAYEFVSQYHDGLDHPIEQGGLNLSGGQKQRLLIARALLHGGSLLILDDSTSALDFISDKTVRQNLQKKKDLTKIIVSQRATSLADCDQIFVYDKGRIVAQGKHDELLKTCPIYKDIYEMQVANQ